MVFGVKIMITIILLSIGASFAVIGAEKFLEADEISKKEIEKAETNVQRYQLVKGESTSYSTIIGTNKLNIGYVFNLETNDVFSTFNQINYTISLYVSDRSLITDAVLIFGKPNQGFINMSISDADSFVDQRSRLYGDTVKLFPDPKRSDYFHREGNITFPVERELVLYFLLFDVADRFGQVSAREPLLSIVSSTAKLQADTNRNIIDQINEERKSIKEQEETNARIEGLTWLALSAVFIVPSMNFALRYYSVRR